MYSVSIINIIFKYRIDCSYVTVYRDSERTVFFMGKNQKDKKEGKQENKNEVQEMENYGAEAGSAVKLLEEL